MISYEDLCQALDKFNRRRRNEAELAGLEQGADDAMRASLGRPASSAAAPGGLMREAAVPDGGKFALHDAGAAPDQPAEDTHEIDVDEMVVDDK